MRRYISVLGQYMRISFASAAAYRADFLMGVVITLLGSLLAPLLTILIYSNDAEIPGWHFHEALLIQAVYMLCTGLCAPFFNNMVWNTMDHVREGTYDLLMLRPGSTIFITVASAFSLENTGSLLGGILMFAYALTQLPSPSLIDVLQFVFLFSMGVCMYFGFMLLMAAVSFKWVGNSRLPSIYHSFSMFGRYPGTIFPRGLQFIISFGVPVAMLGYFPASAILGRTSWEMFAAALSCVGFLLLGWGVFRRMIYLYQSAGG